MSSVLPPSIPAPDELRTLRDALNGVLDGSAPLTVSELSDTVYAAADALMTSRPPAPDPVVDGTLVKPLTDEGDGATGA